MDPITSRSMTKIALLALSILVGALVVQLLRSTAHGQSPDGAVDIVLVPHGCRLTADSALDIAHACEGSTGCVDALVTAECGYTGGDL